MTLDYEPRDASNFADGPLLRAFATAFVLGVIFIGLCFPIGLFLLFFWIAVSAWS